MDAIDVPELLRGYPGDQLRIDPLGYDDEGMSYWYFYGTRLYKEENAICPEEEDEEKPKKKSKKKNMKDVPAERGPWTVGFRLFC